MRIAETKKIVEHIGKYAKSNQRMLHIGSSTLSYRTIIKPHIHNILERCLFDASIEIVNHDIKMDDGIDLSFDLLDLDKYLEDLVGYDIVLVANLLEHIPFHQINSIVLNMRKIGHKETLYIFSCPCDFPYHEDPIDNGFRPNQCELNVLLHKSGYQILECENIKTGTAVSDLKLSSKLSRSLRWIASALLLKKAGLQRMPYYFKQYTQTIAVAKRG